MLTLATNPRREDNRAVTVGITLNTGSIAVVPGGLPLHEWEEFFLCLPESPRLPPGVFVQHDRFLGFPHVMLGRVLCVYLDPYREWDPAGGATALLNRLYQWLADAAGAQFDAATALYHAVGGVLHRTEGTPTLVVRGIPSRLATARLTCRSPTRLDVVFGPEAGGDRAPLFFTSHHLPLGAANTLDLLLAVLGHEALGFLTALSASAVRNLEGTPQYYLLAIPHPAGGPHHLLGGRLPPATADALRSFGKRHGPAAIQPSMIRQDTKIEWCNMSDERAENTTRRDSTRPASGLLDKTAYIWGCGGLGSWMAEFIVRAGISKITLCDPGTIIGGLLVRQNYTEADIGKDKATALADRLRALSDAVDVTVDSGMGPASVADMLAADIIVDATVSLSVQRDLDSLASSPDRRAVIAQVATDARSATLGILHVSAPGSGSTLTSLDESAGASVMADGSLELYQCLWNSDHADELTPTRGCSAPTFHGSAADVAVVAGTLTSLIGSHLRGTAVSGTHLVASPTADAGPRHRFLPRGSSGQRQSGLPRSGRPLAGEQATAGEPCVS
jgi:hypothetical protein